MKTPSATAIAIIAVLLCALTTGGQQAASPDRLPPAYDKSVATIPTVKGKLDSLANAAGILQAQLDSRDSLTNQRIDLAFSRIAALGKHDDELTNVVNANAAMAGNADSRLLTITNQLDDLKRELDNFKDAACPVLRRAAKGPRKSWDDAAGAMADQNVQMRLDTACGLR